MSTLHLVAKHRSSGKTIIGLGQSLAEMKTSLYTTVARADILLSDSFCLINGMKDLIEQAAEFEQVACKPVGRIEAVGETWHLVMNLRPKPLDLAKIQGVVETTL